MRWMPLLALICAWMPLDSGAATNLFRIGVPWPEGSKGLTDLQTAGRDIARKTAGRVQVKFVEQLDLDSERYACDGALLVGSALSRRSPAAQLYSLPLLFRSAAEAAGLRVQMDANVAAELAAQGLELVALLDMGFAYIHSRQPVETVAQWQATRLWVPPTEPEALRMVEAYGLAPVQLEVSDVRAALHDGAVDAVIVPPLGAILLQWHVEVKSVSTTPFLYCCGAVAVRNEALARLEVADQVLVRAELARAFSAAAGDLRQKEAECIDVLVQNGVVPHPLGATPEQQAEWAAWAAAVAERLTAAGVLSADHVGVARRWLAEYRAAN